jgi:hypothetical protein|tara:strand:+ start:264 stop:578 length:315 start_codon:yes stop_codon:yes gene_type:complete
MSKTIFDMDETSVTTFEEEQDGTVHLTKHMDVEPILKINKEEYHSGANNNTSSVFGRKVASIPVVVWQNWMKATNGEIQNNPQLLSQYLNDPDNKFLRTHNSRV